MADEASFRERWDQIKQNNKASLADYLKNTQGVAIDPQSIGVGMGATQGFGGGAMLGFALIVLFSWYRTRQANAQ